MRITENKGRYIFPLLLIVIVALIYSRVIFSSELPGGPMSDTEHQGYPFLSFVSGCLDEGHFPHWNPTIFCGTPFYSSFSMPLFYPVRGLLLLVCGAESFARFTFPMHVFLGGLFAFLFLGSIGVGKTGRIFGALAFAMGAYSNTLFYAGHGSKVICWSYLPLLLYSAEKWMRTRRLSFIGIGGLALGMQALASHPQIMMYSFGTTMFWAFWRALESKKNRGKKSLFAVIGLTSILVLGLLIGAVQLLPGYNFSRNSTRGEGLDLRTSASYSLPPEESLVMLFPHVFGYRHGFPDSEISNIPVYWGRLGLRLSSEFIGVTVFLMALSALFLSPRKTVIPFLVIAVIGLVIAWGGYTPVYGILYRVIPFFRKLRAPHMAMFIPTAILPLLAGIGVDSLSGGGISVKKSGKLLWVMGLFAGLCLFLGLSAGALIRSAQEGWWSRTGLSASAFPAVVSQRINLARTDFFMAATVAIFIFLLTHILLKKQKPGNILIGLLIPVMAFELIPLNRDFQYFLPQSRIESIYQENETLTEEAGAGRVFPGGNDLIPAGLLSVSGYHAARTRIADRMLGFLQTGDLIQSFSIIRQTSVSVFQLNGYIASYENLRTEILDYLSSEGNDELELYFSESVPSHPLPRFFFPENLEIVSEAEMETAAGLSYARDSITLITELPAGLNKNQGSDGLVQLVSETPNSLLFETRRNEPGMLVITDMWYSRWKATVDDEEMEIHRVNFWQRGIAVPAGSHIVKLWFDGSDVAVGGVISVLGLLIAFALVLFERIDRLKSRFKKAGFIKHPAGEQQ